MAAYEYQALDTRGRTVKGVMESDAERQVRSTLREKGLTPLDVRRIAERLDEAGAGPTLAFRRGLSTADLALITRQFATLERAGLPIESCLNALVEQTESSRVRTVLAGVRGRVLEGQSLSSSMGAFGHAFPDIFRSMVDAGEQSGRLGEVLERLADYMENRQVLQNKIIQAFVYPALVTLIAIIMVSFLMVYVVPKVAQVFINSGQTLPTLTQLLIDTSDVVRAGGLWWPVGIISLLAGFRLALKRPAFRWRWHNLLLRLPVSGRLVRGVNAARMASTLGILTASGISMLKALHYAVQVVSNLPMHDAMDEALRQVREGGSLSQALGKARLFPPLVIHLIASGEATGKLDTMLLRASEAQSRELENWVKTFTAVLEPLLIVGMGVMVLLIVLAILMPIFEMNQLVR